MTKKKTNTTKSAGKKSKTTSAVSSSKNKSASQLKQKKSASKKESVITVNPSAQQVMKEDNIPNINKSHENADALKKLTETENKTTETIAETAEPPKRKRRKKGERTWEEKAKKLPTFEVSNFPKKPVKNILITQAKPSDLQNPYQFLTDKYKVQLHFRPFIKVEGLSAQEFRNQRVDVLEYNGIIFTSRLAIDYFFKIMNEMRITIPDTTKFFCMNEQIAYYMQKYMELRKRRILWGAGTLDDLMKQIKKHLDLKYLLPASDTIKEKVITILEKLKAKYASVDVYKTVPENISDLSPEKYDMIVFFTPIAAEALHKYFPKYKQNNTRFAAYSILTANKLKELGYRVDIYAPTLEFPSMVNAIAHYLLHSTNK